MKKIIADISTQPGAGDRMRFYCQKGDGQVDKAITHTLLRLIAETESPSDAELDELVFQAAAERYIPKDPSLPDWGVNDKNVWLVPPMAEPGHICISNENTYEFAAEEGGQPQQFTYEQFQVALAHWRKFLQIVALEGKESLVGMRFETVFPD
ncbi:MAG: hypothetical protein V4684_13930 [Pseudomonadota bacterium]